MKIETLVVTVDQHDFSLVEEMNIQTDVIIGNQSDFTSEQSICYNGNSVMYYSTSERGVGKNRNLVMDKATADICIFADDDMRFVDGYPEIVQKAILEVPDADIWIFNLIEKNPRRYINTKIKRVSYFDYAKYGTARVVIRRKSIKKAGIKFSLLFGGGAYYGSGEDTIFLKDCLNRGLKIVAVPYALAEINQGAKSTWFSGYTEKFFFDKGALYAALSLYGAPLYCFRYLLKYRNKFNGEISFWRKYQLMLKGIGDFRCKHSLTFK